ncbi:hypothetical protein RM445_32125, partial [Pseudonocardia sp. DSM 45834]
AKLASTSAVPSRRPRAAAAKAGNGDARVQISESRLTRCGWSSGDLLGDLSAPGVSDHVDVGQVEAVQHGDDVVGQPRSPAPACRRPPRVRAGRT